jgi:hypothetical protein
MKSLHLSDFRVSILDIDEVMQPMMREQRRLNNFKHLSTSKLIRRLLFLFYIKRNLVKNPVSIVSVYF